MWPWLGSGLLTSTGTVIEQDSATVIKVTGTHSATVSVVIVTHSVTVGREIETQSVNLSNVTEHILLLLIVCLK